MLALFHVSFVQGFDPVWRPLSRSLPQRRLFLETCCRRCDNSCSEFLGTQRPDPGLWKWKRMRRPILLLTQPPVFSFHHHHPFLPVMLTATLMLVHLSWMSILASM